MNQAASPHQILIVCYGNICRSPIGEYLMRQALQNVQLQDQYEVHSAGVHALVGRSAASGAQQASEARGLSLAAHEARQLTVEMAMQADTIIAMDEVVEEEIMILTRDRVVPVLWPVDDPYGGEQEGYETAFEEIRQRVEEWVRQVQIRATSGDNRGAE